MREFAHTRVKIIEGREEKYRVSSPEDIVSPKLVRGVRALKDNPELEKYLIDVFPLTSEGISRDLKEIESIRQEVRLLEGDLDLASRLRFVSDVYDIKVLAELAGFNEDYLSESMSSWDCLNNPSFERNIIMNRLFSFFTRK